MPYFAETEKDPDYRIAEGQADCASLLRSVAEAAAKGSSAVMVVLVDDTGDNFHTYQFGCDSKVMKNCVWAASEYLCWIKAQEDESEYDSFRGIPE